MVTGFPPASSATPARHRMLALAACLGLALLALGSPVALAGTIKYTYDDLGRLIAVDDGAGNFSLYVFDPVGNILQILRPTLPDPAAPVGVAGFTPARGAAGTTTVTVFGKGFSPTPAQNEVRFNGVLATVSASSPTQLTATAPGGATTGLISVRVGANTGTSAQPFVVLLAPTVTPPSAALFPRQTQTFTATQPSQWRANNVMNGNATVGTLTVSPDGLTTTYIAPAAPPPNGVVTITAANAQDFTLQASATVEVLPPATADPLWAPLLSVVSGRGTLAAAVSVIRAPVAAPLDAPLVAVAREPVVTAVQPASAPRGTTQTVVLLGAGFAGATPVAFLTLGGTVDSAITVNSFTVDSSTQLTANISIASGATPGFRVARVTAAGATSSAQGTSGNLLEVLP